MLGNDMTYKTYRREADLSQGTMSFGKNTIPTALATVLATRSSPERLFTNTVAETSPHIMVVYMNVRILFDNHAERDA